MQSSICSGNWPFWLYLDAQKHDDRGPACRSIERLLSSKTSGQSFGGTCSLPGGLIAENEPKSFCNGDDKRQVRDWSELAALLDHTYDSNDLASKSTWRADRELVLIGEQVVQPNGLESDFSSVIRAIADTAVKCLHADCTSSKQHCPVAQHLIHKIFAAAVQAECGVADIQCPAADAPGGLSCTVRLCSTLTCVLLNFW